MKVINNDEAYRENDRTVASKPLTKEEEYNFIVFGVPIAAIELVNHYRLNGYPFATIHIPFLEKYRKIGAMKSGRHYDIGYDILLSGRGMIEEYDNKELREKILQAEAIERWEKYHKEREYNFKTTKK